MRIESIIVAIFFLLMAVRAFIFILLYFRLTRVGVKTTASIPSIKISNSLLTKFSAIPIVKFLTADNKSVKARPILSWFFPINNYMYRRLCDVYYDPKKPSDFIVSSTSEVWVNIMAMLLSISIVVYLILAEL
ncbi:MAG: hypothetical protein WAR78_07585 [Ferruginibacter sp.]